MEEIKKLIGSLSTLADNAVDIYTPIVNDLITSNCKDVNKIELTLDYMLGYCFHKEMLMLYRKLCRHLYGLDQDSAVFYVNHYREMFDEDSSQKFEPIV